MHIKIQVALKWYNTIEYNLTRVIFACPHSIKLDYQNKQTPFKSLNFQLKQGVNLYYIN